jgi:hypothetical protein
MPKKEADEFTDQSFEDEGIELGQNDGSINNDDIVDTKGRDSFTDDERGGGSFSRSQSVNEVMEMNMQRKVEKSFFNKLNIRIKNILEKGVLSIEDSIAINSEIRLLPVNMEKDPEITRNYSKIKEKLRKIEQRTFNWKVDHRAVPHIKQILSLVDLFWDSHHFLVIDYPKLQYFLPPHYFMQFMKEPYHSYDESDKIFFEVIDLHSLILAAFRKLYISFPMATRPKIHAAEISLLDPFMRQMYRESNRSYFYASAGLPDSFNFIDFLGKIMEKFVFSGLPRWEHKTGTPLLIPLLQLIGEGFDYGLIDSRECDLLLGQLYMISEILSSLENQIKWKYSEFTPILQKYFDEFLTCRIIISQIVIQIIAIYCDYDHADSVRELKLNPNSAKILRFFLMEKKAAYSNISLIILKYLAPKLELIGVSNHSQVLEQNVATIFNYIGDYDNDIFTESTSLIRVEYIRYYLGRNSTFDESDRVDEVVKLTNDFVSLIRTVTTENRTLITRNFVNLLSKIKELFTIEPDSIEMRLELTRQNLPALLIQIVDFLDENAMNFKEVVQQGLEVLGIIVTKNYPGQSVFFSGHTFKNYKSIFSRRYLIFMTILANVFNEDYTMFNLATKVFLTTIQIYKDLITAFETEYKNNQKSDHFIEILGSLFVFNYFFDNILDTNLSNFKIKRRYDLIITGEILNIMENKVFPSLFDPEFLPDYRPVNFNNHHSIAELKTYDGTKKYFSEKDPKILLFETYFSFLKLFNKSTFKLYSGEVYEAVRKYADTTKFVKLPSGFPNSIYIRMEMFKMFDRFHVFFSNHLLSKRGIFNKNAAVIIGEVFVPDNTIHICEKLKNEFAWFDSYIKIPQNNSSENANVIGRYLLKGLLATLYKYLKGILGFVTIMEDQQKIETLKQHSDELVDLLMSSFPKFQNYVQNMLPQAFKMLMAYQNAVSEKEIGQGDQTNTLGTKIGNFLRKSFSNNEVGMDLKPDSTTNLEAAIDSDILEERINPNLRTLRERISTGIEALNRLYTVNKEFNYIIERYSRNSELDTSLYTRKVKNQESLQDRYDRLHKKLTLTRIRDDQTIIQTIKRTYRQKKTYFNMNSDQNRFVQFLKDDLNKHVYCNAIAELFIENMLNMESCLGIVDYSKSLFINDIYIKYMVIMNSLLTWTELMRTKIYLILVHSVLSEKRERLSVLESQIGDIKDQYRNIKGETIQKFMEMVWGSYLSLLMFIYFKTFMDQEWDEYWHYFQVISTFLQNICENNFVEFKQLLNVKNLGMIEMIRGNEHHGSRSVFFENYIVLEVLAMNSNFWLNTDRKIVPSDRPSLFPMIKRVMENVTEMLTGPSKPNQMKIYIYRIDMWTGIINRIIDDIDSKFYEVKLSCLMYISALLEGLTDDIVRFMGSNFEVHKLFEQILTLTKKLYVKMQPTYKLKGKQNNNKQSSDPMMAKFVEEVANIAENARSNQVMLKHPSQLFDIYNSSEEFSDHIIMNIVITTYVMITNMSTKIKFYELFLKDKSRIARNYQTETKNREEAVIFNFILKIIKDVEIVEISNNKSVLRKLYFKMPPRCFFLTTEMMDRFMDKSPVESTVAKHNYLFNNVDSLSIEMRENQKNFSKHSSLAYLITNDGFRNYQTFLIFFALALNIIMLVYLENLDGSRLVSFTNTGDAVILGLAITLAVLSFAFAVIWLLVKYRMEVQVKITQEEAVSPEPLKKRSLLKIYLIECLLLHPRFNSFMLQFVFCLLGIFVNRVFYTLNLLLLTNLSKPINYIMRSIIKHYDKLLVTLVLTILVIFCYSFILLTNYSGSIDDDEYGQTVCETFVSCFINSVNLGLRLDGGIGGTLKLVTTRAATGEFWGRFFFDLSFFIIVRLILLNVIAGIIIDTFSDLRDELTRNNHDVKNVCYICGIDRWKLEQQAVDFDDHINNVHNKWKYLFFLIKLSLADKRDYNGVEFHIWEFYMKNNSSWIPSKRFLPKGINEMDVTEEDVKSENKVINLEDYFG